jgi:Tol biopolymer transport system component
MLIAIFAVAALGGLFGGGANDAVAPSRASSIPAGALKVLPTSDPYPPILASDGWYDPVPMTAAVNTAGGEDSPFVLPDGQTIYFFFTPNVTVPAEKQLIDGVTGIYKSELFNGSWSEATRVALQDRGKVALDGCACVQGGVMWFCSAREGYSGINMFTANTAGGSWCCWAYAGDLLNVDYNIGEVHLSADGQRLYFHSDRAGGLGGNDIWYTDRANGTWRNPVNVGAVNTAGDEGYPFLSQDGSELWFTRTYLGTPAIYRSVLADGSWSYPELIVHQFAGEPTLDDAGNLFFVHHFFINGSMVEADIYVAYRKTS